MKKFLLFILFILFTFSSLYSKSYYLKYGLSKSSIDIGNKEDALDYLNTLRNNTGLISLKENSLLDESAENHAKYLIYNNQASHYESSNYDYFTGETPTDRAHYVGYNGAISENIAFGSKNYTNAIDQLFSAIYHRLGFLDFQIDEIGMAGLYDDNYFYKTVFVFNMGNSYKRKLCEEDSFSGYGYYYYNICIDPNEKISKELYDNITQYFYSIAPDYVLWPYINADNIPPVFFEETPDPLPQCSVSGYPISIQFNPQKFNLSNLIIKEFSLFDENQNKIDNVILMKKDNDPNKEFTEGEYALFPIDRLDFGKKYFVKVIYSYNGIDKEIDWSFKTINLEYPYFIVNGDTAEFNVKSDQDYFIYFKPNDCNDTITSINYSISNGSIETTSFYDANTIHVKISGQLGGKFILTTSNNKKLTLIISDSDDGAIYPTGNFEINQGWSLNAVPIFNNDGFYVDKIFNDSAINTIWAWKNNQWYIWSPDEKIKSLISNYGISLLEKVFSGDGFWINSSQDIIISIPNGNAYGLEVINISSGWNLKGIGMDISVNEIFNKFPKIKTIWIWENSNWKIASNDENIKKLISNYNISTFSTIKKSQGFWIYSE